MTTTKSMYSPREQAADRYNLSPEAEEYRRTHGVGGVTFVQASTSQTPENVPADGRTSYEVTTVYRDRERKLVVIHDAVYRGGCLWMGQVTIRDDNYGPRWFQFSVSQPPWGESGPATAQAYYERHQDKLAVT